MHDWRERVRYRVAAMALAMLVPAAGCGGSDATSPSSQLGTYTMTAVNGQPLPYTLAGTARGTVVIQSGSVTLSSSGGAFQYSAGVAGTANGSATQQLVADAGSYVATGSTLTFTSALGPGVVYTGSLSGTTLSVSLPGAVLGTTGTVVVTLQHS